MQTPSQFSTAVMHLGGTRWRRRGSAMLAQCLQSEAAPQPGFPRAPGPRGLERQHRL